MSVLRNLESKLAGLVEGTFSRAFKSEVRPVEIARKLAKEMEEHKVQSLSRAPTPQRVHRLALAQRPGAVRGHRGRVRRELSGYLLEHARRERITLGTQPRVMFKTDERLRLGEFGIQARRVSPSEEHEPPSQGDEGHTMVYSSVRARAGAVARARSPARRAPAVVGSPRWSLRRRRDLAARATPTSCSRTRTSHATTPRSPLRGLLIVNDLGSTNGIKVNGRRQRPAVAQARRRHRTGDVHD